MKKMFAILLVFVSLTSFANSILVKNMDELNDASRKAQPGDIIILQNGEWNNVTIRLSPAGTKDKPITYKAQTPGKVLISGESRLAVGGEWLIIEGLSFINGYAGDHAVIEFRSGKDELANNCRVTQCSIDNFNNPKRLDENYWIAFYGKHNRLDHCSFRDKKNLGVLLAVILDDDRSRQNFHSIDHNYFGRRIPLASNGGEIIRVGVSQHCEFNSNTQITDNFFEHCDGETEIVSIKSGANLVKGNLFKECQGGVVLRHGNYNIVENNLFLGNDKPGTGGVRVINKGQWVVNNFFYRCRGVDFRSPLSIMNGIINSPANRYVQVTDAVIANNTFMECAPVSFCEGSDAERTLPPDNVLLFNNLFYNTRDTVLYNIYDDIKGFTFTGNEVNRDNKNKVISDLDAYIEKKEQRLTKINDVVVPISQVKGAVALSNELAKTSYDRLGKTLSTKPGFGDMELLKQVEATAYTTTGASWFSKKMVNTAKLTIVNCSNAAQVYQQLDRKIPLEINLTGNKYHFNIPVTITTPIRLYAANNHKLSFSSDNNQSAFVIEGNGILTMENMDIDASGIKSRHFISSSPSGSSAHYNLSVNNIQLKNLDRTKGCENFFFASKSIVADLVSITNSVFTNLDCNFFMMHEERDDKGYYNAEKINISKNKFSRLNGILVDIYRGGNDESTMGPALEFTSNKLENCSSGANTLISLTGVQVSNLVANEFSNCNSETVLVKYTDIVRARHRFKNNELLNSGLVEKDVFLMMESNKIK